MKTNHLVLAMLAIFFVTTGFAAKNPQMYIKASEGKKIQVMVESEKALPFEIEITAKNGGFVYQWKSDSPVTEAKTQFDLSQVGQGDFTVSLNYGANSVNRDLRISKKSIEVGEPVYSYEPLFSFKDNILKVSYLNLSNDKVFLKVYKQGEYFAGLNLGSRIDIQKAIDFSTAGKGEYHIVLTDDKNEHFFSLAK